MTPAAGIVARNAAVALLALACLSPAAVGGVAAPDGGVTAGVVGRRVAAAPPAPARVPRSAPAPLPQPRRQRPVSAPSRARRADAVQPPGPPRSPRPPRDLPGSRKARDLRRDAPAKTPVRAPVRRQAAPQREPSGEPAPRPTPTATADAAPPPSSGTALPRPPVDAVPRGRYHRIEPGDTAAGIAAAFDLRDEWVVYDANPVLVTPDRLPVGAFLYLPHPTVLPARRPRPGEPGWTGQPSTTVIVDAVWLRLAACESSGNWTSDTGNGYYGGLQFSVESWRAVGGGGLPHQAHPLEQIARADALQRVQGWEAWPTCSVKLGLRAAE